MSGRKLVCTAALLVALVGAAALPSVTVARSGADPAAPPLAQTHHHPSDPSAGPGGGETGNGDQSGNGTGASGSGAGASGSGAGPATTPAAPPSMPVQGPHKPGHNGDNGNGDATGPSDSTGPPNGNRKSTGSDNSTGSSSTGAPVHTTATPVSATPTPVSVTQAPVSVSQAPVVATPTPAATPTATPTPTPSVTGGSVTSTLIRVGTHAGRSGHSSPLSTLSSAGSLSAVSRLLAASGPNVTGSPAGAGTARAGTSGTSGTSPSGHRVTGDPGAREGVGSDPGTVIDRFIRVIPTDVWLALGSALLLAAFTTGAAVLSGHRARKRLALVAAATEVALTDVLTGVLNRRGFMQSVDAELGRAQRYGHPVALAFIDVRGLKAINDGHGHLAGDRLLQEVAKLLRESARAYDTVARVGGDEMAVLLPEQGADGAAALTQRVTEQIPARQAALGLGSDWNLTIGTAAYPEDGESFEELLATADRRLYEQRGIYIR